MKRKRSIIRRKHVYLIILNILAISILLAALFILGILPKRTPVAGNNNYLKDASNDKDNMEFSNTEHENKESGNNEYENEGKQWFSEKIIDIIDNSPEYEVEMTFCYDNDKNPFLTIDYFIKGASKSLVYTSKEIPALMKYRDSNGSTKDNNNAELTELKINVNEGILNGKYGKLYVFIENILHDKIEFHLYVFDLEDESVKRLYMGEGDNFNKLIFSSDKKYGAFTYLTDCIDKSNDIVGPEKYSCIQIFNCVSDSVLVADNKTAAGKNIGYIEDNNRVDSNRVYSYSIIRWKSSEELRLREYSYTLNKNEKTKENEFQVDVIFNIAENRVIYPEDTEWPEYVSSGFAYLKEQKENEQKTPVEADKNDQSKSEKQGEEGGQAKKPDHPVEDDDPKKGDSNGTSDYEQKDLKQDNDSESGDSGNGIEEGGKIPDGNLEDNEHDNGDNSNDSNEYGNNKNNDEEIISEEDVSENSSDSNKDKDTAQEQTLPEQTISDKTPSEAVTVLRRFYSFINNSDYERAYNLLDDRVKFNAFKKMFTQMFGEVDVNIQIDKEEIDIEYFALFMEMTGMFKNDEIDRIVSEEITKDTSRIYYYHIMIITSNGSDQESTLPMIATLNKTAKGWKISAFDDGDPKTVPFN